jgi:hypothetical protein
MWLACREVLLRLAWRQEDRRYHDQPGSKAVAVVQQRDCKLESRDRSTIKRLLDCGDDDLPPLSGTCLSCGLAVLRQQRRRSRRCSPLLTMTIVSAVLSDTTALPPGPRRVTARRELEDLRAAINHHRREGLCSEVVSVVLPEKSAGRELWLKSVVQGYLNYYAVPENTKRLGIFRAEVCRAWLHALRRRSQRSRMTWEQMKSLAERYIPKVRALHLYPHRRFAS